MSEEKQKPFELEDPQECDYTDFEKERIKWKLKGIEVKGDPNKEKRMDWGDMIKAFKTIEIKHKLKEK